MSQKEHCAADKTLIREERSMIEREMIKETTLEGDFHEVLILQNLGQKKVQFHHSPLKKFQKSRK